MRIALDAMGGDHSPHDIVLGAVEAAKEHGIEVILVGPEDVVQGEMAKYVTTRPALVVAHASQVISMSEPPIEAVRQKGDSSIVVGLDLVKRGAAAAFVSAGNTGAVMAAALFTLGRIPGIDRPALAATIPTSNGACLFLDAGANADCKPSYLLQFAYMGSYYMEKVLGVKSPRVALLSNGEEDTKGNQLVKETAPLLRQSGLNFQGFVEGKDLVIGAADVVVTDGFTGNVVIKVIEGVGEAMFRELRRVMEEKPHYKLAASFLKPALKELAVKTDYAEYGGVPLLGVNGVVVIAHGRSNAKSIKNSILSAKGAVERDIVSVLEGISSQPGVALTSSGGR
ncbi:MAG: Phosphate acyltransferase [Dehalococcoidia bacterium]|nr:Phosphate acyltransferase [Dehalococcoidia bacterium]